MHYFFAPLLLGACVAATVPPPDRALLEAGERAYQKCYACHALEPGRNDLGGPTLHDIVGRKIAAEPGFPYSEALRRFAADHPSWTPSLLDAFVRDPEALVPRTDMSFHGMPDPREREALIAYLGSFAEMPR